MRGEQRRGREGVKLTCIREQKEDKKDKNYIQKEGTQTRVACVCQQGQGAKRSLASVHFY